MTAQMEINKRFLPECRAYMKAQIKEAGGNEVFFAGTIDEDGVVVSVAALARGHKTAVPANHPQTKNASVLIHNHPSGFLEPSDDDIDIAVNASEQAKGFYIVNNSVTQVYVAAEPVLPKKIHRLDGEAVSAHLSLNGEFAKKNERFEERESQIELARRVCQTFNENGIGVFEAGTGVGKSFAYLIPAILWQQKNKERIVISTGTINLQQQLMQKDIPAALGIVDKKIKTALVKGRQQYVCLRRLNYLLAEPDLFFDEQEELNMIALWARQTGDGSRSDLSFQPSQALWQRVNSESDGCMGMRCDYHESCFVMRAKKDAQDAGIIVANHHLLFADVEARLQSAGNGDYAVLPSYERIIFDEAHGIEEAATSFFSEELTRFKLAKFMNALFYSPRRKEGNARGARHFGVLWKLSPYIINGEERALEIAGTLEAVKDALLALDNAGLDALAASHTARLISIAASRFEMEFAAFSKLIASLSSSVSPLEDGLDECASSLENQRGEASVKFENLIWEARRAQKGLLDAQRFCKNFLDWQNQAATVFWLEKSKLASRGSAKDSAWYVRFMQTPLEIASKMNEGVFEPVKSVVCVSATLKTAGGFSYWMGRTGVSQADEARVDAAEFPSPFPYDSNVLFALPVDAPLPQEAGFQSFIEEAIPRLIDAAHGRTLVLFTSYDSLRSAWDAALGELSARYALLRQGDDDRARLLDKFKNDTASVLFATDSFWTGIDVPGESLSQVIIVKLPFSVPTDPVTQARCEALESEGKNSFMELSVPDAIIKFRQGFGRLIRHSDDRGVITVLDKRIAQKSYGRLFVESVPETKRIAAPLAEVSQEIAAFLRQ
jgi:ATP-dependent DNA helicase DinG